MMEELKEELKLVECPSNWGLDKIKDRKSAAFIIDKLYEKDEEIAEPWVHVCINLTVAYLYSENNDVRKSISVLKECDEILHNTTNEMIVKYKSAFEMVCIASKAVFLSTFSTYSETKQFADRIVRSKDLNRANEAAFHAIKAAIFSEFGVSGSIAALDYAKEALRLSPQEGDWHFLMGKLLSRIRHFSQDHEITPAEISHLQTAFSITKSARAAIFLANALLEKSRNLNHVSFKHGGRPDIPTRKKIKELTSEAQRLIQCALDINNNSCVHIVIRCAFGLTKLPRYERDYEKAKELLSGCLKRSPLNPMANKLAGDICLQEEKPMYHEAMKHFEIAASRNVYSANFALFEIKTKLSLNTDSEKFYNEMLNQFTEKNYILLTLVHATEYYLFIRRELTMAANYFTRAIALDKDFHGLTDRWVKYLQKNVNLYDLMGNEVRYVINNQLYSGSDQLFTLQTVLDSIKNIKPGLMACPIIPNKVQTYLDAFENERKTNNSSKRGRGAHRGRGQGRGQGGRGRGRGRGGNHSNNLMNNFNKLPNQTNTSHFENNRGRRSRSSSRNRLVSQDNQQTYQENVSNNKEFFDKSQFDRISYAGDKSLEVVENPYFFKFLELKYKKMTDANSFKDWLQKYGVGEIRITAANKANGKENADSSDGKFQELVAVINQLKQDISDIKLNDTRSCCSGRHSLKSLEYKKSGSARKQDEYFSDRNDFYRQKYLTNSRPPSKDRNDKYCRSHRDDHRWRSEGRSGRYNRLSPSREGKDKYERNRFYDVSPTRKSYKSRYNDFDSSRSNDSDASGSSTQHRHDRREKRHSFSERNSSRNNSRYNSPSRRSRRYRSPSPLRHRGRSKERRDMGGRNKHISSRSSNSSSSAESRSHRRSNERKQRIHDIKDKADSKYGKKSISGSDKHFRYRKSSKTRHRSSEDHLIRKSTRRKESSSANSGESSSDHKKNGNKDVCTNRRSSISKENYDNSSSDSKSAKKSREVRVFRSKDTLKKNKGGDRNSKKCKNVSDHPDDKSSRYRSGSSPDSDRDINYSEGRSFHKHTDSKLDKTVSTKQQSIKKIMSKQGNNDKDENNDKRKEEKKDRNPKQSSERKLEDSSREFESTKSVGTKKYGKYGHISTSESSSEVEDPGNEKKSSLQNLSSGRKKEASLEPKISSARDKGKQYLKPQLGEEYLSTSSG